MIKRLKIKFVCLSLSAAAILLLFVTAGLNIINYNSIIEETDQTLSFLSQHKGAFPQKEDRGNFDFPAHMSPETPYESRYFSVLLNSQNNVIQTETSRIISVNSETALEYAKRAMKKGDAAGFVDNFRYVRRFENQDTRYTFLDCGRRLDSFWAFLWTSVLMSVLGIVVIFFAVFLLADKIILPVAEAYQKQKRFITDAGHEIKTPLTIINANVDLLETDPDDKDCLKDIKLQTKRLSQLTNDLVYLAKMEEDENDIIKVEIPISDIVAETVASFRALAFSQGKKLMCNIEPMLCMKGNHKAVEQLISIVMDNALKYSPEGSAVTVDFVKVNRSLHLNISNVTLAKIESEGLKHIFERFYRTDKSRNSDTGGYGIGLSVAKAIVNAHGGKITAWTKDLNIFNITCIFPI